MLKIQHFLQAQKLKNMLTLFKVKCCLVTWAGPCVAEVEKVSDSW